MVRVLAPAIAVDGPPATPPPYGLRSAARQIFESDSRWQGGLEFVPENCYTPRNWDPVCNSSTGAPAGDFEDASDPPDAILVRPFQLYVPVTCDAQSYIARDLQGVAQRALEAGTSKGMEQVFWSGIANSGNFSLVGSTPNAQGNAFAGTPGILNASATTTPVGLSPDRALATLSQFLGACGLGSRGMVQAPPFVVTLWAANGHLDKEGERLVTEGRGDIVVSGAGYPGTGPTGNPSATPTSTAMWVYATGMVEYRLGDIGLVSDQIAQVLDRKQNVITWTAERMVAITNDGCCTAAVLVSVT